MLWSIFGGMIILALGIVMFLKPHIVWKLTEEWKSYGADEPSDLYLKSTKMGGIILALLGVIMMILPLLLE